ncbi:hypothetical protein MMC07_000603 [Pseudocyphellaria aurata]|nr:hypothetical protein [Pseudocyphellaria aurata]
MNARVEKPRTHSSCLNLSKPALEKLDAFMSEGAGLSSPSRQQSAKSEDQSAKSEDQSAQTESTQSQDIRCAESEDLTLIAPPVDSSNSQSNQIFPPPEKNGPSIQTHSGLPIEDESAVRAANPIYQPKPLPLKRSYTSFLTDCVDQPSSRPSKRYRPECVDRFVTRWVESVSGSESYRKRRCRSDSPLDHSGDNPGSRRLTKSAPDMAKQRDPDVVAKPDAPASTSSRSSNRSMKPSDSASSTGGTGRDNRDKIKDPSYRLRDLATNHIYKLPRTEQIPEHIDRLIAHVSQDRHSPGPSADDVRQDTALEELEDGVGESAVEDYFKDKIFPKAAGIFTRTARSSMARRVVPDTGTDIKVVTPAPDLLYGYHRLHAFPHQQAQLNSMGNEMEANGLNLLYPFFVMEFKGDCPSGAGSLWVATNQCLGGSSSCVNIAEQLNDRLRQCKSREIRPIDSAAFSLAMSGTEARLYISWKQDELRYYLKQVDCFVLQKPGDYLQFRNYVRNIFDWAKDRRLTEIRDSLDQLLERSRLITSEAAKARLSPSDEASMSSSKRTRTA